jgi:hypothetical protein
MNPVLARLLTRLYPRSWRERYGEEFEAHLETGPDNFRTLANIVWVALLERIFPTQEGTMKQPVPALEDIIEQPSAVAPIGMSLIALAVVLSSLIPSGVVHQGDEGWEAHIWQLLMAGQLPIVFFFAIKWLPRAPFQALRVLAMQAGAALVSMAPVFLLHL